MIRSVLTLLAIIVLFSACSENFSIPEVEEPAGYAQYFINNSSSVDLQIVFTKSPRLDSETDTAFIKSKNTGMILEDGIVEANPKPSDSFSSLEFYKISDSSSPFLSVDSVRDGQWAVVGQDIEDNGYGLTQYEFEITDEDVE